jgi:hypothetical protein
LKHPAADGPAADDAQIHLLHKRAGTLPGMGAGDNFFLIRRRGFGLKQDCLPPRGGAH